MQIYGPCTFIRFLQRRDDVVKGVHSYRKTNFSVRDLNLKNAAVDSIFNIVTNVT
jgi:hypothetical protein